MSNSTMLMRTYKYQLYPSPSQTRALRRVLDASRGLYNMALAEPISLKGAA